MRTRVKAAANQLCPKKCVTEKNRANLVVTMPARVLKHPKDEMENIKLFLNRWINSE